MMRSLSFFSFVTFISTSVASPYAQAPYPLNATVTQNATVPQNTNVPQNAAVPQDPTVVVVSRCKAVPGTAEWPSDEDWAALNEAVKGRLLKPDPPAAACHRNHKAYNAAACAEITDGFTDSSWHTNHPTSNMWQNYNNYSCMPTAGGSCSNDGFPIYVVQAKEASDVKAAVDFAREKNVRLNIKSTGHDFLGRSVQPNSLSIWTHGLREEKWFTSSFTPEGCNFAIDGTAVTVGSGTQWKDLKSKAKNRDVALVSGAFSTVSVGGYLANGGHGGLSAKYGLGADMVLQIELVNAAGEIITANECQNQEYFWAMRGGGGSTYGVVLTYTIQAIPTVPTARFAGSAEGWDQIAYIHSQWHKVAMAGGTGYLQGYPGRTGRMTFTITLPNATSTQLHRIVDPIMEAMPGGGGGGSRGSGREDDDDDNPARLRSRSASRGRYTDFATWAEAEGTLHTRSEGSKTASFPGMGSNKLLVSWLYDKEATQNPGLKEALRGALSDSDTQFLNDATMGIGTHNPPYMRGGGNAVNPAFRTAVMRPAAELQWTGTDPSKLAKKKADALRYGASLRTVNPNGGTYANEADPDMPDWQHAFWGTNYEKLFDIKTRVDPRGVFYCRACVGSELFEDRDGVLCRA